MSKTRNAINKRTVLFLLLPVVALYVAGIYIRYRSLHNDDLMIELINNDERVEFEYIQFSRVSPSPKFKNIFGSGSTLYIRYFTAWKYPLDEVSKADNYKKHGWVDMRHRVHVSITLRGNQGFI